jgi:hypothetical protein
MSSKMITVISAAFWYLQNAEMRLGKTGPMPAAVAPAVASDKVKSYDQSSSVA